MRNVLKITLLFAVFILATASVFGQQDETIRKGDSVTIKIADNSWDSIKVILNFRTDQDVSVVDLELFINDIKLKNIHLFKNHREDVFVKKGDSIRVINKGIYTAYVSIRSYKHTVINENILTKEVQLYSYDNNVVLLNQNNPKNLTVDIYTLTGQLVKTEQINGLYDKTDLQTNLPSGIYVVRVSDGVNAIVKKLNLTTK